MTDSTMGSWHCVMGQLAAALLLSAFGHVATAQTLTVLHPFSAEAGTPRAGLLQASDGRLYGTTAQGCAHGLGSVYAVIPEGPGQYGFATLYCFTPTDPGNTPMAKLIEGSDGAFYGTASAGGNGGAVFRVTSSGALTFLHAFTGADGSTPVAPLVLAADGKFYGTTEYGGSSGQGTIFRVDTSGNFATIHSFVGGENDGAFPLAGLIQSANDGLLYGTTVGGGSTLGYGMAFRTDTTGAGFAKVYGFVAYFGASPEAPLVEYPDGNFYGTTYGSAEGFGTIFRMTPAGEVTTLGFIGNTRTGLIVATDGNLYGTEPDALLRVTNPAVNPNITIVHAFPAGDGPSELVQASNGLLYGASERGSYTRAGYVYSIDLSGGSYSFVHAFVGAVGGTTPVGALAEAGDGSFYGVTQNAGSNGGGTIFRVDRRGNGSVLHSFVGPDGELPPSGLVLASDGAFYGVTQRGAGGFGGTVFRFDPAGVFEVIHKFDDASGSAPQAALIQASDGKLYGTTQHGGPVHFGTLFRVSTSGDYEDLHDFTGYDGFLSSARLLEAAGGSIYGTTEDAGDFNAGVAFRWDGTSGYSVLHSFSTPGYLPQAGLIEPSAGSFFGTTRWGGAAGMGTIYALTPTGDLTTIHELSESDGGEPEDELLAVRNELYGVTTSHGAGSLGTIFRTDDSGAFEKLHDLSSAEGGMPLGALVRAGDGNFYGTASTAGAFGGGSIFRLTVPDLLSLIDVSPSSGPPAGGTAVAISGAAFQPGAAVTIAGVALPELLVAGPTEIDGKSLALTPGTLADLVVTNPDATSVRIRGAWYADFLDTPQDDPFHSAVETLVRFGVTAGCGNGYFCGGNAVSRAQMAVFLLKSRLGPQYQPPAPSGGVFLDVPAGAFAAAWIEDLASRGITAGCRQGFFCPDDPVTRAQMAVFLLKTSLGVGYVPPPQTGNVFDDVPVGTFAGDWIEDIARRGITAGCLQVPPLYCPADSTTRSQMAALLGKTFDLH